MPGEDFQATVNQALFVGNGNVVDEWLKAGQNNLADELIKLEGTELAERLTLAIFSRMPDENEKKDIAQSLSAPNVDKARVIHQWMWALLSSSEFRFNH